MCGLYGRRCAAWRPAVGSLPGPALTVVLVGLLLSSLATEWLGLHFLFGPSCSHGAAARCGRAAADNREEETRSQPGPVAAGYFLLAGLKVDLSGLDAAALRDLALILVVAVTTKAQRLRGGPAERAATP